MKVTAEEFIAGYAEIAKNTGRPLESFLKEITATMKALPDFKDIQVSNDDMMDILKNAFNDLEGQTEKASKVVSNALDEVKEQVEEQTEAVKEQTKAVEDQSKETKSIFGKMVGIISPVMRSMAESRHLGDIQSRISSDIDYILGDVKSSLAPIGSMGKLLFTAVGSMKDVITGKNKVEETQSQLSNIKETISESVVSQDKMLSTNIDVKGILHDIRDANYKTLDVLLDMFSFQIQDDLEQDRLDARNKQKKGGGGVFSAVKDYIIGMFQGILGATGLKGLFTKIKGFRLSKIFKPFEMLFGWLKQLGNFTKTSKIFSVIKSFKIGALSKLFGKLFMPLTILLGVFDFIKGFAQSESNDILGKVKDGVKSLIIGILGLPVKLFTSLLGWLSDKIFGTNDMGSKIYEKWESWVGFITDVVFKPFEIVKEITAYGFGKLSEAFIMIKRFFEDIYDTIMTVYDNYISPLINKIIDIFSNIVSYIGGIFVNIYQTIASAVDSVFSFIGDKAKSMFDPIVSLFTKIGEFTTNVVKWVGDKIKNIPVVGKLFMNKQEKNAKDEKEIASVKQEITNLENQRSELIKKQKEGTLSRRERRQLSRIDSDIKKKTSKITDIQEDISSRKAQITKKRAKKDIKGIFKSGAGVDDWGANKILKPQALQKYSKEQLQGILKYGNWEKESEQILMEAIKNAKSEKERQNIPSAADMFAKFEVGKGKISDLINVDGKYVRYNYDEGQKYKWTPDDIKKMYKDYKAGKEVSTGTAFIPKDEAHLNQEFLKRSGNNQSLVDRIKKDEGYRPDLYRDSRGFWTGGFGTLISKNKNIGKEGAIQLAGKKFGYRPNLDAAAKKEIWEKQLNASVMKSRMGIEKIAEQKGVKLSGKQKDILTNMGYNMGTGGVRKFQKMWDALKQGNPELAAKEMENSKWYNQVPNRVSTLATEMKNTAGDVAKAKAQIKKKEIDSRMALGENINKGMEKVGKSVTAGNEKPIIVTTQEKTTPPEPPEDIEAMSILWLNKSYGLG